MEGSRRLAERGDDLPVGGLGEGLHGAGADVALHADLQVEPRRDGVVRRLVDQDEVIVAKREEDRFELAAHVLQGLFCRVEAPWRLLNAADALFGPVREQDICRHGAPPRGRARQTRLRRAGVYLNSARREGRFACPCGGRPGTSPPRRAYMIEAWAR